MQHETKVIIPDGMRLVGVKTEDNIVVIVYEPIQIVQSIGFDYFKVIDDTE